MSPIWPKRADVAWQTQMTDGLTAGVGVLDDAAVGKYVSALGDALDISKEQALAIMANLRFLDFVAN